MNFSAACLAGILFAGAQTAAASPQEAQAPPPLGRLFLTPEARADLERQRSGAAAPTAPAAAAPLRLDGVVVRSSGPSTVWINRQPHGANRPDGALAVGVSRRQPDRATVSAPSLPSASLPVGATLDPSTGAQRGLLDPGALRVRPARQP